MTDLTKPVVGFSLDPQPATKLSDQGNGTYAEVIASVDQSVKALTGGQSQSVAVSTTSAQSAAINATSGVVYSTVDVFFRTDANPTALADGTDQLLPASTMLRVVGITSGHKMAFKTATGTGTVYITPGA